VNWTLMFTTQAKKDAKKLASAGLKKWNDANGH
jgi:hypothetical protein